MTCWRFLLCCQFPPPALPIPAMACGDAPSSAGLNGLAGPGGDCFTLLSTPCCGTWALCLAAVSSGVLGILGGVFCKAAARLRGRRGMIWHMSFLICCFTIYITTQRGVKSHAGHSPRGQVVLDQDALFNHASWSANDLQPQWLHTSFFWS